MRRTRSLERKKKDRMRKERRNIPILSSVLHNSDLLHTGSSGGQGDRSRAGSLSLSTVDGRHLRVGVRGHDDDLL
jgi:hypothetical protein